MKGVLRIIISCVFAFAVLFLCSVLIEIVGMKDNVLIKFIGAGVAFFSGKYLNTYLKGKYPNKKV